jgi:multiple sugar transport system ATP-binding protein
MNFLPFQGTLRPGDRAVRIGGVPIEVPEAREGTADVDLVLGARPEQVRLSDAAPLRASVLEAEYLGTNQIVTLATAEGSRLKARISSEVQVRPGDQTGLAFKPEKLSVFHAASGRVLRSALHEVAHG